jgi:hypothetical protein
MDYHWDKKSQSKRKIDYSVKVNTGSTNTIETRYQLLSEQVKRNIIMNILKVI